MRTVSQEVREGGGGKRTVPRTASEIRSEGSGTGPENNLGTAMLDMCMQLI